MLETIRAYALGRLAEQGESEVMQRRHTAYFAQLVAGQADALRGV